jgi:hypothetical protein
MRKPIQFDIKVGLFQPLTYVVVCDDGAMFWAQPTNGKDVEWKRVRDVPQETVVTNGA